MRIAALVLVAALAACNQNAPGDAASGGGLFPDLNRTAYRAEATLTHTDGTTIPVVMVRDGQKMRMEINAPQGQSTLITNADTGESFIISNAGGQTMAIRASGMADQFANPAEEWRGELAENATRTGSCSAGGENGEEWTKTTEADGTDTVCVTDDGIILRASDDGRVVWETTSVQRGAQSADLFTLPPGVQVMDLGNVMNEALERAKQSQQ